MFLISKKVTNPEQSDGRRNIATNYAMPLGNSEMAAGAFWYVSGVCGPEARKTSPPGAYGHPGRAVDSGTRNRSRTSLGEHKTQQTARGDATEHASLKWVHSSADLRSSKACRSRFHYLPLSHPTGTLSWPSATASNVALPWVCVSVGMCAVRAVATGRHASACYEGCCRRMITGG
jgi:hypothetical protein